LAQAVPAGQAELSHAAPLVAQEPFTHGTPLPHTIPQPPQLFGSVAKEAVVTQLSWQQTPSLPPGNWHASSSLAGPHESYTQ
jgi:hypothetical protein